MGFIIAFLFLFFIKGAVIVSYLFVSVLFGTLATGISCFEVRTQEFLVTPVISRKRRLDAGVDVALFLIHIAHFNFDTSSTALKGVMA